MFNFNVGALDSSHRFSTSIKSRISSTHGLTTGSNYHKFQSKDLTRTALHRTGQTLSSSSTNHHSNSLTAKHLSQNKSLQKFQEKKSSAQLEFGDDKAGKKTKRKQGKKRTRKAKKLAGTSSLRSTAIHSAQGSTAQGLTAQSLTAQSLTASNYAASDLTSVQDVQDIGDLGKNPTLVDSVGSNDPTDDYRFALNTPSTYRLTLNGVSANTGLQLLDSNRTLLKSAQGTPANTGQIDGALTAGTYYIRVISEAADTAYTLSGTSQTAREFAKSAYSFVDSMGVVTHLRYLDTAYSRYDDIIKPRLQELGVRHIRDGGSDAGFFNRINDLAKVGIKSTLVIDPRDGYTSTNAVQLIQPALTAIEALEGPNEWDVNPTLTYKGQSFPNGIYQFQSQLYKTVKSDPTTAGLSVIAPSLAMPHNSASLGSLSSVVDMGNMHSYAGGNQPSTDLDWKWIPQAQVVSGTDKPIVATEAGWHNAINDGGSSQKGVSEAVSGKYIPRAYLEYFNRGVKRTFMYELIDQRSAPDQENNFGLLRADGSPKPAFTATRNLINLLNDSVAPSQLGSLDYYLTGNTQNVNHTLLQKSNGDFYLVMWLEKPSSDVDISQNVTVNLMSSIEQATTYLPNQSTSPTAQYAAPTQLSLNVPDYPLVVQLHSSR